MPHDTQAYLADMLDACCFVIEVASERTVDDYRSDRMFRSAVERELQNLGEALFQLHKHDPASARRITEHERIIRFRHVLVHGYHSLNPELVWYVVEEKLPQLRNEVSALLGGTS